MPTIKKTRSSSRAHRRREVIVEEEQGVQPWGAGAKLRVVGQANGPRGWRGPRDGASTLYPRHAVAGMLVGRFLRSPNLTRAWCASDSQRAEAMPRVAGVAPRQPPPVARMDGRDLFPTELSTRATRWLLWWRMTSASPRMRWQPSRWTMRRCPLCTISPPHGRWGGAGAARM